MGSFESMAKVYLLLLGLMLVSGVFSKHDEWYCKKAEDKYEICRKCKTLDEDCDEEPPADCKCENLKFANFDYEMIGGPEQCQKDDKFCYVSENSNCDDAEYSSVNGKHSNIWLNPEVYFSYDACDARIQDDNTGNEEDLEGVKITGDDNEDLELYLETSADCKKECSSRCEQCGSWSFDKSEKTCYLHSVDSCCGQLGKREINSGFNSGYNCQECWSTKANTDCPCSFKDGRQEEHCPGEIAHSSAGDNRCVGEIELESYGSEPDIKKRQRRGGWGEWQIKRNIRRQNPVKSKNAILADGACCWTVTGSKALFGSLRKQRKEIRLTSGDPVKQLGFYVKKLKAHKCT